MFRKLASNVTKPSSVSIIHKFRQSSLGSEIVEKTHEKPNIQIVDTRSIEENVSINLKNEPPSVLDKCQEDISHVAPYLKPAFNFAAYVNKSETLLKLVNLGVNLHKLEKDKDVPPLILQLNFEADVKNYIIFFTELGLHSDEIGNLITKNPYIFKCSLDDLITRINYLKFKKFDNAAITRIVQANPIWLNFSTQEIDERLGFFQKTFDLTGNEVRDLSAKRPKLITYNLKHIKLNNFVLKEEMGFTSEEIKEILLEAPAIFTKQQNFLLKTFEYVHRTMKIPLERIVKMPKILTFREFKVRQRHMFLEKLGRAQYNPKEPKYVSLTTLVCGTDSHFSTEVAGSSVQAYNIFLKSL